MIQDSKNVDNSAKQNLKKQQSGLKHSNSQFSNKLGHHNQILQTFNDQENHLQVQKIHQNDFKQGKLQTIQNDRLYPNKVGQKQEYKNTRRQSSIQEDVVNEDSSISKSVSYRTIQLHDQKLNSDAISSSSKMKVRYGNQTLEIRQNQIQIIDQMNNSIQSFHSKKSKDLQVYSAQDNKMLVLQVRNPDNIEKLRNRIEADEKRKQSGEVDDYNMLPQNQQNILNNDKKDDNNQDDSDKILSCKICLEEGDSKKQGKLFTPCQCTGTCKWIHEECLKEWIISRYVHLQTSHNPRDFLKAECEICKFRYKMKFETSLKFHFKNIQSKLGRKNFITCLCSLLCVLGYVFCFIFFFALKKSENDEEEEDSKNKQNSNQNNNNNEDQNQQKSHSSSSSDMTMQSYQYALIIVCSLLIILSGIVCFISTRQAFYRRSISKWIIYKYDPQEIQVQNQDIQNKNEQNINNLNQQNNNLIHQSSQDVQYYNGQSFQSGLRSQQIIQNNFNRNRRFNNRELAQSTQAQSVQQNSILFNLNNSELNSIQQPQGFDMIQNQSQNLQYQPNQLYEESQSIEDNQQNQEIENIQGIQNTQVVRINSNILQQNNFENSYDNSQDISSYEFNNNINQGQRQIFNLQDNY